LEVKFKGNLRVILLLLVSGFVTHFWLRGKCGLYGNLAGNGEGGGKMAEGSVADYTVYHILIPYFNTIF
jgi:ascorbate-specific PTS system EIIC-type component UlaA